MSGSHRVLETRGLSRQRTMGGEWRAAGGGWRLGMLGRVAPSPWPRRCWLAPLHASVKRRRRPLGITPPRDAAGRGGDGGPCLWQRRGRQERRGVRGTRRDRGAAASGGGVAVVFSGTTNRGDACRPVYGRVDPSGTWPRRSQRWQSKDYIDVRKLRTSLSRKASRCVAPQRLDRHAFEHRRHARRGHPHLDVVKAPPLVASDGDR